MAEPERRIYLDYAASTPADPRVLAAMEPYWKEDFGNAGSLHAEGKKARAAIENARAKVAQALGVSPAEVTFTSGGTESNNLAIFGTIAALGGKGRSFASMHAITSAIEHSSVSDCFAELEKRGVPVSVAPVDQDGIIDLQRFAELLRPETVLVSVLLVSNEIGTIQPIKEIAALIRKHELAHGTQVYLHVDASQGFVYLPAKLPQLDADLVTVCSQKLYGPKGVGALGHRARVPLAPLFFGGTQENGLRPGTPVCMLIVGLGEAISIAEAERSEAALKAQKLRDRLFAGIRARVPGAVPNGSLERRIANSLNFSFPGHSGELLALRLDRLGLAASTRSACLAGVEPGSHVVRALGRGGDSATSAVRFSVGKSTTEEEIDQAIEIIAAAAAEDPRAGR